MDNENISINRKENMENGIDLNGLKKIIPNGLKTDLGILSIVFMEDSDMWVRKIQNTYEEIQTNWKTFPHIFPTLNGHKFFGFGTEEPGRGKYYLCSTISENDPTSINGLEKYKITWLNKRPIGEKRNLSYCQSLVRGRPLR
jgi:hypothetical protein